MTITHQHPCLTVLDLILLRELIRIQLYRCILSSRYIRVKSHHGAAINSSCSLIPDDNVALGADHEVKDDLLTHLIVVALVDMDGLHLVFVDGVVAQGAPLP